MIEKTLAKRYATALLAVTDKEGTVDETGATLLALGQAYHRDPRFRTLLSSPQIPRSQKKAMLRKLLGKASASVQEFFDLLVEKNRTALMPDIGEMYDRLADVFKGIVRVQVRSTFPLTEAHRKRINEDLNRITGKRCELEPAVDRSLKGGLLLRMGDSVVDGTVRYKLKTLREKLQTR